MGGLPPPHLFAAMLDNAEMSLAKTDQSLRALATGWWA